MIDYRALTNDEIIEFVNPVCRMKGWAELNITDPYPTCYVIGAFDGVEIVGFFTLQLHPFLGPLWVDSNHSTGEVSRELVESMDKFVKASNVRGVITIADSPVSARLAERHGMTKVESPVYIKVGV